MVQAIESIAEADAAAQAERRRQAATQRKLDRARADRDAHSAAAERLDAERRAARDELEAVMGENRSLRAQLAVLAASPAGPNRAARRKADKHDRRSNRDS